MELLVQGLESGWARKVISWDNDGMMDTCGLGCPFVDIPQLMCERLGQYVSEAALSKPLTCVSYENCVRQLIVY